MDCYGDHSLDGQVGVFRAAETAHFPLTEVEVARAFKYLTDT